MIEPLAVYVENKSHFPEWASVMIVMEGIVRMWSYNSEENCQEEVKELQNNDARKY